MSVRIVLPAAILVLAGSGAAQKAPDLPEAYRTAREAYHEAAASKDKQKLAAAIPDLARAAADGGAPLPKEDARKILRKHLRTHDALVLDAALRGYGILALRKSSQDLKPLVLRRLNERRPQKIKIAALQAWASIHDPGTHADLLEYIRVPSHLKEQRELAAVAARCLGAYKEIPKKHRYELLKDLMHTFDGIQRAGSGTVMPSAAAAEWLAALSGPMVGSFNALTGQKCATYHECVRWWKKNKRKLKAESG